MRLITPESTGQRAKEIIHLLPSETKCVPASCKNLIVPAATWLTFQHSENKLKCFPSLSWTSYMFQACVDKCERCNFRKKQLNSDWNYFLINTRKNLEQGAKPFPLWPCFCALITVIKAAGAKALEHPHHYSALILPSWFSICCSCRCFRKTKKIKKVHEKVRLCWEQCNAHFCCSSFWHWQNSSQNWGHRKFNLMPQLVFLMYLAVLYPIRL